MPGPNYVHFPDWLGEWFYDELTYEERGIDGKWQKPGKGANEAFDLMVYAHALVILRGYERISWDTPPEWARRGAWVEAAPQVAGEVSLPVAPAPDKKKPQRQKAAAEDNPWSTSGGWV